LPADDVRQRLLALLGDLPPRDRVSGGQRLHVAMRDDAIVERWLLDLNCRERVPALLVSPPCPRAVVLYCHAHGHRFDLGKEELIAGRPALASPPYAEALAGIGVAALAIDHWLASEPRHARLPVITLGMSMGSTMAWWAAALEPRIAACVDLCCLAEFDALVAAGADDLHGEYYFVPGLRKHFTAAAINALIAPRPAPFVRR
jgi:hypothetical protein